MDDPFPSCRLELVQMPTDQREYEQNLSLQTRSSDAEGILQLNTSQPYNPCPPGENRSTFRSDLTPGSTISYGHPGYTSNAWDATVPEPYELSSGQVSRGLVPENAYLSPPYSTPQFSVSLTTASPDSMDNPLSPSALKHVGKVDLLNWQTESVTFSTPYGTFYQHPAQMETSEGNSLATRANSTSPPISISSQQSPPPSFDSMSPTASATVADSTSPQTSFGDISDQDSADPPYSRLIWEALRSADGNQMPLRVIYKWFEKNTSKGKDKNKGWQNSIRHNLSMNAGFEAVKGPLEGEGRKTVNYWKLTQEAIENGVQSTTRYRKANQRKMMSPDPPALGRQQSGSKGGRAAKHAARMRHTSQEEQHRERSFRSPTSHRLQQPPSQLTLENPSIYTPPVVPMPQYQLQHHHHYHHVDTFNGLPSDPRDAMFQGFGLDSVTDCTPLPPGNNTMFCDTAGTIPDCPVFDMGGTQLVRTSFEAQ